MIENFNREKKDRIVLEYQAWYIIIHSMYNSKHNPLNFILET